MTKRFLFPFQEIEKGSKIVLYGAGLVGRRFYEQCLFSNYCQVLMWVDTNYQRCINEGLPILPPIRIKDVIDEYDYVVISILSQDSCDSVKNILIGLGIKEKKIIYGCKQAIPLYWNYFLSSQQELFKERFRLSEIVQTNDKVHVRNAEYAYNDKIQVRCIYGHTHKCNSIYSVYQAFNDDVRFETKIIGCDENRGNVMPFSEYNVENDRIDILIVTMFNFPGDLLLEKVKAILEYSKSMFPHPLLCCIPFSLLNLHGNTQDMLNTFVPYFDEYRVDYCMFDKFVYDEVYEKGFAQSDIIQCFGNPKFDRVYAKIHGDKKYPKGWEKLKGKKIFLVTTDHNAFFSDCSIDLYFKTYIRYFTEHEDYAMILRPHPLYFKELLQKQLLTEQELQNIKDYCNHSENIVFDELPDYGVSYKLADFVVADINCGIMFSALPLGKPICVPVRYDENTPVVLIGNLLDAYYCYHSPEECVELFDMLASGKDPKREKREAVKKTAFMHCDGKNGKRIKDFLVEKYFERVGNKEGEN